jgi:hypothetical protein
MRSVLWLIGLPVSWAMARFGVMRQARINADFYGPEPTASDSGS